MIQVDSRDSLENVESKWVGEIAENCQGVKLVLVALKCDLRASGDDEEEEDPSQPRKEKDMIDYKEGLEVARRIQALRYLGIFPHPFRHFRLAAAEPINRMLRETEPWCQRGLYGSRASGALGQDRHVEQQSQVHRHVNLLATIHILFCLSCQYTSL